LHLLCEGRQDVLQEGLRQVSTVCIWKQPQNFLGLNSFSLVLSVMLAVPRKAVWTSRMDETRTGF
jgi:hypothetical protein